MNSIKSFFSNWIDYAGLFPPAQLPMSKALETFAHLQKSPMASLAPRFVLPLQKWDEFVQFESIHPITGLKLHLLLSSDQNWDPNSPLGSYTHSIATWCQAKAVVLSAIEIPPLPEWTTSTPLSPLFREKWVLWHRSLPEKLNQKPSLYFEVPWTHTDSYLVRLAALQSSLSGMVHAKWRTGGTQATHFPSPQTLGQGIIAAQRLGLASKVTAGLHEAISHNDDLLGVLRYGFLNVFFAFILTRLLHLSEEKCIQILKNPNPADFVPDSAGWRYENYFVSLNDLAWAQKNVIHSVGSCSFTEPLESFERLFSKKVVL